MTPSLGTFPFGQPLRRVVQVDRTPKRVFVLGVYASAIHARWVSPEGRTLITALAVASEPYIFWRGDGAEEILAGIRIPEGAGKLLPASPQLNGPPGRPWTPGSWSPWDSPVPMPGSVTSSRTPA